MARKRQNRNIARNRITPAAVEAFKAGNRLELHRALNLPPWQASPLDAVGVCPWPEQSAGALSWASSVRLREELQCAA